MTENIRAVVGYLINTRACECQGLKGKCIWCRAMDAHDELEEVNKKISGLEQETDPPDWMINEREDHERFEANE